MLMGNTDVAEIETAVNRLKAFLGRDLRNFLITLDAAQNEQEAFFLIATLFWSH